MGAVLVVAVVNILTAPVVNADAPPPVRVGEAGERFTAGEEAFRRGEFARAGELFEQAHERVAHFDSSWNAAHAWLSAGDRARAATWFASFLDEAPSDAPDRAEGTKHLRELAATLGRIEIDANGIDMLRVDGRRIPRRTAYVAPGTHRVEGRAGDATVARDARVEPGQTATVTLAPTAPPPLAPPERGPAPESPSGKPWSPLPVVIGGVITAGLAGTAIFFGAATESAHDRFAKDGSQAALDDGRAKQDLTNGFFWGALATGVITSAVALLLVDWKKPVLRF